MIRILLRVALDYFLLRFSKPGEQRYLVWQCMLENTTYRLDKTVDQQPSIGFRVLYRTLKRIRSGQPVDLCLASFNSHVFYDANHNNAELKKNYIAAHRGIYPSTFLSKESIVTVLRGIHVQLLYVFLSIPLAIRCTLSKRNRTNRALHISHLAEATALLVYLQKAPNCFFYDFAPYHIDSNWLYTLTKGQVKEYIKLPSPGPLTTHHSILLCDVLVLSSAYQEFEITKLKNVQFSKTEKWLVERALSYLDLYASREFAHAPMSTIGYYSHASWLRAQENHRDIGFDILHSEETLLKALAKFLEDHPSFKLTLFLHPRERRPDRMEQTMAYYSSFLPSSTFAIADTTIPSAFSFHHVDISVSALSTILFERLFCGFKTLIWNAGMAGFPDHDSELMSVSISTPHELTQRLLEASQQSIDAFFSINGLEGYRYSAYPYYTNREAYFIEKSIEATQGGL